MKKRAVVIYGSLLIIVTILTGLLIWRWGIRESGCDEMINKGYAILCNTSNEIREKSLMIGVKVLLAAVVLVTPLVFLKKKK